MNAFPWSVLFVPFVILLAGCGTAPSEVQVQAPTPQRPAIPVVWVDREAPFEADDPVALYVEAKQAARKDGFETTAEFHARLAAFNAKHRDKTFRFRIAPKNCTFFPNADTATYTFVVSVENHSALFRGEAPDMSLTIFSHTSEASEGVGVTRLGNQVRTLNYTGAILRARLSGVSVEDGAIYGRAQYLGMAVRNPSTDFINELKTTKQICMVVALRLNHVAEVKALSVNDGGTVSDPRALQYTITDLPFQLVGMAVASADLKHVYATWGKFELSTESAPRAPKEPAAALPRDPRQAQLSPR